MKNKPNFRPRVVEFTAPRLGVELEFHENIPGLNGDTFMIHLADGSTMEQAEELVRLLHDLGEKAAVTNPG